MRSFSRLSLATVGLLAVGVAVAQAQSATTTVTATVQQTITVTARQNMSFGVVTPGVTKHVSASDATAGRFDIFMGNGTVSVTVSPPMNLTSDANNMPTGSWEVRTLPSGYTGSTFPLAGPFTVTSNGVLSVYVGGSVMPSGIPPQPVGPYTGNLTLTVSYL